MGGNVASFLIKRPRVIGAVSWKEPLCDTLPALDDLLKIPVYLRKKSISKWNICFGFSIMDSKTYSYMS
jgi:hypothetical protein